MRIDAQLADEYSVIGEDDPRIDRPILPATVDLSKLDDDAFEAAAERARADRNRLESSIKEEHENAARHREAFARELEDMGVDLRGAALEGATLDPILDAAWNAIKDGRIRIDPTDIGRSAVRGAAAGIAMEGAVLTGKLIYHAQAHRYASERAKAGEGARGQHNEWGKELERERRERGRIRLDN
jgi:hypothetical protein